MAEITLEILKDNSSSEELENFVLNSANGTLFHSPRFLSYHGEEKFTSRCGKISHLLFRKGNRIAAFMPAMLFKEKGELVFHSPYGGSYGSFVYQNLTFGQAQEIIDLFLKFLQEEKVRRTQLVPPPPPYCRDGFLDYFQYLLLSNGFQIKKADLLIVCRLEKTEGYPLSALKKNARKFQAQALRKGVEVKLSEDYRTFHQLLVRNRSKFEAVPTHSYEELVRIKSLFPDRVVLWLAYLEDIPIGGALFFLCNKIAANCFYLCHEDRYAAYRSTNLLITEALGWLARQGFEWMDFGSSSFGYRPHSSLIRFKESFGGLGVPRYYYLLENK